MGKKGKRFELDTKNAINEDTREWVKAHRPDFSGNSLGEVADIMVVWESRGSPEQSQNTTSSGEVWQANRYEHQRPCGHSERHVAYGELKKRSGVEEGNRKVVMSGSSKDEDGMGELRELITESPSWSGTYVGIKFPNRELIVIDAEDLRDHLQHGGDYGPDKGFHGARLTRGNNISMVKPELESWPSSTAGEDDHIKFLHGIGIEDYDIQR